MIAASFKPRGDVHDLAALTAADVDWAWLAHSLAWTYRFNGGGYGTQPFSVAQHSVMGADALHAEFGDKVLAGIFLLHDGHEWRIGDVTRPVVALLRHCHDELAGAPNLKPRQRHHIDHVIERAKAKVDAAVYAKAKLPAPDRWPVRVAAAVKAMDDRMCAFEAQAMFGPAALAHFPPAARKAPPLRDPLKHWPAARAEEAFLDRLKTYLDIDWRMP